MSDTNAHTKPKNKFETQGLLEGTAGNDNIVGTSGNDIAYGYAGDDTILLYAGNDISIGGEGADYQDGGYGLSDTVSFADSSEGVTINIWQCKVKCTSAGTASNDTAINFESVVGSNYSDVIEAGFFTSNTGKDWIANAGTGNGKGAITKLPNSSYIIAFSNGGLRGQLYNFNNVLIRPEFVIKNLNTIWAYDITYLLNGGYFAVYYIPSPPYDIKGMVANSAGTLQMEKSIHPTQTAIQMSPAIDTVPDTGELCIVWEDARTGTVGLNHTIWGTIWAADGSSNITTEFQISNSPTSTTYNKFQPFIAAFKNYTFFAVWEEWLAPSGSNSVVHGRLFTFIGSSVVFLSDDVMINSGPMIGGWAQASHEIITLDDGVSAIITWADGSNSKVYGRMINTYGGSLTFLTSGTDVLFSGPTSGIWSAVASIGGGGFIAFTQSSAIPKYLQFRAFDSLLQPTTSLTVFYAVSGGTNPQSIGIGGQNIVTTWVESERVHVKAITLFSNFSFYGGSGNDTLKGWLYNDTLDGGADFDTASYEDFTSNLTAALYSANGTVNVAGKTDTLTNIEKIVGTSYADTIEIRDAAISVDGGPGYDTVKYTQSSIMPIYFVNQSGVVTVTRSSSSSTLNNVEEIVIPNDNAVLYASLTGNTIINFTGKYGKLYSLSNSTIFSPYGTNISIDGGSNKGIVSYQGRNSGITLSFSSDNHATSYWNNNLLYNLANITKIIGSDYDDSLTVNSTTCEGKTFEAAGGNDTFILNKACSNYFVGGSGTNTISYSLAKNCYAEFHIYSNNTGGIILTCNAAIGGHKREASVLETYNVTEDTFSNVQVFYGTNQSDTFNIALNNTVVAGLLGADTFRITYPAYYTTIVDFDYTAECINAPCPNFFSATNTSQGGDCLFECSSYKVLFQSVTCSTLNLGALECRTDTVTMTHTDAITHSDTASATQNITSTFTPEVTFTNTPTPIPTHTLTLSPTHSRVCNSLQVNCTPMELAWHSKTIGCSKAFAYKFVEHLRNLTFPAYHDILFLTTNFGSTSMCSQVIDEFVCGTGIYHENCTMIDFAGLPFWLACDVVKELCHY